MSRKQPKPARGRPPRSMPEPIPATPEEVARVLMQGPPKKEWRYLKKGRSKSQ